MAPEQFLGERGDERSDQFSFCVALYEALYGERPFAGDDMLSISVNVTTEQLRPLPKDRGVPTWVRRVILRGLKVEPAARWESMAALIRALRERSGRQASRRRLDRRWWRRRWRRLSCWSPGRWCRGGAPRPSARSPATSRPPERRGVDRAAQRPPRRAACAQRAFAAFDAMDKDEGETLWRADARACCPRSTRPTTRPSGASRRRSCSTSRAREHPRAARRTSATSTCCSRRSFGSEARRRSCRSDLPLADADGSQRKALAAPRPRWRCGQRRRPRGIVLERYERDPVTGRRNGDARWPRSSRRGPVATHAAAGIVSPRASTGPGLAQVDLSVRGRAAGQRHRPGR